MNKKKAYHIKYYSLLMWILMWCNFSYAQYDNISFTNLSSEDGLSQNTIFKIFQDSDGFVWFGTEDGLNKYDGYEFKLFEDNYPNTPQLITKEIRFIDEDSKGSFWFGSPKGLNKYQKKSNTLSTYMLNAKNGNLKGNDIKTFMVDTKDNVWASTNLGVFYMDNDTFYEVYSETKNIADINQIIEDNRGDIWFVNSQGIYLFKQGGKEIEKVYNIEGEISFSSAAIVEDAQNNLWLGTTSGIFIFNKEKGKLTKLASKNGVDIEKAYINTLELDKNNNLWVGTFGQGLLKVEYKNHEYYMVKQYSKRSLLAPKLSSNHIHDIFIDKSNVLWVGTVLGGINKGNLEVNFLHIKTNFKSLNIVEPDPIFSICEDSDNNLWLGTYGFGLYKLNKNTNAYKFYPGIENDISGFKGAEVYNIIQDQEENIWLATSSGGLLKYDKETDTFDAFVHKKLQGEDLINSVVFKGSNNNIWIGTWDKGVFSYDLKTKKLKHFEKPLTEENKITTGWVNYIVEDVENNRLWVSYENGLQIIDLTSDKVYKLDNSVEAKNGLVSNYVYSIHQDSEGTFWLGTDGALIEIIEYNLKDTGILELKTNIYTKNEGLLNDVVYGMLEDKEKNLWMSTNKGLTKFNFVTKKFNTYLDSDGLQANEFNMGAFYKSQSGEFLFGGVNGITAFYPDEIKENKVAPKIVITQFRMLNNEVKPGTEEIIKKDINEVEELEIDFKDHLFSFEIAALEYSNSKNNQYAYKLEGFDKKWNFIGNRRHITFTNLNPGKYILKIKGANNDGVWSENTKDLKINILPPFWRTLWFYILCGLFLLTLGFVIAKARMSQATLRAEKMALYEKNEEKNAMLKEIHHRIKNNLQVVNSLLSLQSREINDEKVVEMFSDARRRVLSMALLHERMYGSVDLIHVDIHEHFQSLIENLVKSYAVDKKIKLEMSIKDAQLGISTLTPLGLLLIEIVSNSLKYAFKAQKKGTIKASLQPLKGKKYELIIGDDGIGFTPERETNALGTKLIYIFTKQLNGTIEKLDQPGTVYKLIFEKIDKDNER